MCDKAADNFLPTLKFLPDWFITSKMTKQLFNASCVDDDITVLDDNSGNVTFLIDEMGILSVNLNKINLDDANFL